MSLEKPGLGAPPDSMVELLKARHPGSRNPRFSIYMVPAARSAIADLEGPSSAITWKGLRRLICLWVSDDCVFNNNYSHFWFSRHETATVCFVVCGDPAIDGRSG